MKNIFFALAVLCLLVPIESHAAVQTKRDIIFPVAGNVWYTNSFQDPREAGKRWHKGVDIFGKKMTPLVAVTDGTITLAPYPAASWGYGVRLTDKDGYEYWYIHLNNDNPGTDDGRADGKFIYAPDIMNENPVVAGQLIGYMGDSGNAETTPPHLHFEMYAPGENLMNPYESLVSAKRISSPVTSYPELPKEILPFGDFSEGSSVAIGKKLNEKFMITGAGPKGEPLVRVFKTDKTPIASFYAFDKKFRGGVDVAAGDVNGDGTDEIIVAAGPGGTPHLKAFDLDGNQVFSLLAFDARFRGGLSVTASDVNGDGKSEIITAPKSLGGPHVKAFGSDGKVAIEFMAYDPKFRGGIDVASTNNTIVTSPLSLGGPHVKLFSNNATLLGNSWPMRMVSATGSEYQPQQILKISKLRLLLLRLLQAGLT